MELASLNRLMREGPTVSSVSFTLDAAKADQLYNAVKSMPAVAAWGYSGFHL